MTPHRLVGINTSIGGREQSEIIKVLDNYNLVPDKIERVRSAYKIICGSACYYLKKTNHGDKKAYKVMQLIHYLKNNHFSNIADYIKTKDNKECIKKNHCIYYMTQWIEGKESDFDDLEEIKKAAMLLAQFHISAKGFYVDGLKIPSNIKNWPLILSERKEDLIYFKKAIENKKIKTSFDAQYGIQVYNISLVLYAYSMKNLQRQDLVSQFF
jgi:CotS family spore coat protein